MKTLKIFSYNIALFTFLFSALFAFRASASSLTTEDFSQLPDVSNLVCRRQARSLLQRFV